MSDDDLLIELAGLDQRKVEIVDELRDREVTWERIGEALGISRHAAMNWWRRHQPDSE